MSRHLCSVLGSWGAKEDQGRMLGSVTGPLLGSESCIHICVLTFNLVKLFIERSCWYTKPVGRLI